MNEFLVHNLSLLSHYIIQLEKVKSEFFKFDYGEKAQNEAVQYLEERINRVNEESKTLKVLYGEVSK